MSTPGPESVRAAVPAALRPPLVRLLEVADRRGIAVHLVGGPVRDLLLGRPLRDVDLVVEPTRGGEIGARELAAEAAPAGARIVSHDRFRTVTLEVGGAALDLATVRAEQYPAPGALPVVRPGTLEEDLRRRDFTVNGLALPLSRAARRGRPPLVDPGSGLRDLEARQLRIFHERSFHDDPTRALRAARLVPRLGFCVTRSTRAALRGALRDGAFAAVSGERYRAELEKLFADPSQGLDPAQALRLLHEWHVLAALEPGLGTPLEARVPLRRLGRMLADPPWPLLPLRPWLAGCMVWLAPLEAGLRRRTLRRLAVQGEPARRVGRFPAERERWLRKLARARGRGPTDAALQGVAEEELLALVAWAPAGIRRRILRYASDDRHVSLPLGGEDLVALGLSGPAVGRALARVRVAVLDRTVRSRQEALDLAREIARRSRRRPAARGRG